MKIVAEGIESREQVDFLAGQECDLIQGYFFAKPMPVEEYAEKINTLENEHARQRLESQKELKVHSYYIEQAQLTLSELQKQMIQIKESLE